MECETAHERAKRHLKAGGYVGGHGEAKSEDKAIVRKAIGEHDRQLHSKTGSHVGKTRLKFKRGGHVEGKHAAARPDRKRRASGGGTDDVPNPPPVRGPNDEPDYDWMKQRSGKSLQGDGPLQRKKGIGGYARGGAMNGVVSVDRRYKAEGIDQPHGPEKRADGGAMRHKSGGKGKIGAVNIAIKAGGGQAEKQMAAQKGLQAGMMIGARRAAMGGAGGPPGALPPGGLPIAGPGGMPPGGGAMPPGGPPGMMPGPGPMRPGGGMAGGPPMGGPPPGAMPPRPPGPMASGGDVRMRDERGRFLGGAV